MTESAGRVGAGCSAQLTMNWRVAPTSSLDPARPETCRDWRLIGGSRGPGGLDLPGLVLQGGLDRRDLRRLDLSGYLLEHGREVVDLLGLERIADVPPGAVG